jgi:leucyl aminopeptidase
MHLTVLVGNTDAEGRMAMADLLAEAAERALALQKSTPKVKCHLFTVATLTGHVIRAYGPYPACLDNGPARVESFSQYLANIGATWGEPWEISTLRAEDYAIVKPKSPREDVLQWYVFSTPPKAHFNSNTAPSTMTSRGHQFPAAFMIIGTRLLVMDKF